METLYGLNQTLHNGEHYYPESNIVEGNAFFGGNNILEGELNIDGEIFQNQRFQYDLFRKDFILLFVDRNGAEKQIVLNSEFINTIKTEEHIFVKNRYDGIENCFVELIYEGKITWYFDWSKQKQFRSSGNTPGYFYRKQKKKNYIVYNNQVYRIRKIKNLLEIFPEKFHPSIKRMYKQNRFRFKSDIHYNYKLFGEKLDEIIKE